MPPFGECSTVCPLSTEEEARRTVVFCSFPEKLKEFVSEVSPDVTIFPLEDEN